MEKRMARDLEKYKSYLKSDAWAASICVIDKPE
jgi:hypothetical protein